MIKTPKELNNVFCLMELARELEVMGTRLITKKPTDSDSKNLEEIADEIDRIRLNMQKELGTENA